MLSRSRHIVMHVTWLNNLNRTGRGVFVLAGLLAAFHSPIVLVDIFLDTSQSVMIINQTNGFPQKEYLLSFIIHMECFGVPTIYYTYTIYLNVYSWNVRGPADFHSSYFVSSRYLQTTRHLLSTWVTMKGGSSFSYHFKLIPFRNHITCYLRFGWLGVICQFEYVIKW